jgi:DNA-binding NarL/FixJ family response regulator
MLKVLLAEDSDIMRAAISRLLAGSSEAELVAEAKTYRQMMQLVDEHRPNVVLMDLHMRDENNVTIPEIKACLNDCQLFVISIWQDVETKADAESLGAVRLLDKSMLGIELIPALKQCASKARPEN